MSGCFHLSARRETKVSDCFRMTTTLSIARKPWMSRKVADTYRMVTMHCRQKSMTRE